MKTDETRITVGVDVSKHRIDVFELGAGVAHSIPNTLESIEQWLDRFLHPIQVAIKATNSYHELVTQAWGTSGLSRRSASSGTLSARRRTTREGGSPGRAIVGALS